MEYLKHPYQTVVEKPYRLVVAHYKAAGFDVESEYPTDSTPFNFTVEEFWDQKRNSHPIEQIDYNVQGKTVLVQGHMRILLAVGWRLQNSIHPLGIPTFEFGCVPPEYSNQNYPYPTREYKGAWHSGMFSVSPSAHTFEVTCPGQRRGTQMSVVKEIAKMSPANFGDEQAQVVANMATLLFDRIDRRHRRLKT